jgi:F-type H+-transporting ATPase subunit b
VIPDLSVLIVIALVLTCTALLNRLIFKPVLAVMDQRERAVRDAKELAESASQKATLASEEYDRTLTAARRDVYREMDEKRRAALEERGALLAATKADVERELSDAVAQLSEQTSAARARLQQDVDGLAAAIMTRVLGRAS